MGTRVHLIQPGARFNWATSQPPNAPSTNNFQLTANSGFTVLLRGGSPPRSAFLRDGRGTYHCKTLSCLGINDYSAAPCLCCPPARGLCWDPPPLPGHASTIQNPGMPPPVSLAVLGCRQKPASSFITIHIMKSNTQRRSDPSLGVNWHRSTTFTAMTQTYSSFTGMSDRMVLSRGKIKLNLRWNFLAARFIRRGMISSGKRRKLRRAGII